MAVYSAHFHGNAEQLTGHPMDEEPFNIDVILNVKWRGEHRTLLYFCCLGNVSSRIMNVCVMVEGSFGVGGSIPYKRWCEGKYTCWQVLGLKIWMGRGHNSVLALCRNAVGPDSLAEETGHSSEITRTDWMHFINRLYNKVKLSWLIKHHVMKTYEGVEV
jgi:hypothetical protein